MRLDLTKHAEQIGILPRFQLAKKRLPSLLLITRVCVYAAVILSLLAIFIRVFNASSLWIPLLCNNSAVLLLLAMVTKLAYHLDIWRVQAIDKTENDKHDKNINKSSTFSNQIQQSKFNSLYSIKTNIFYLIKTDVPLVIGLSSLILCILYWGWDFYLPAASSGKLNYAAAVLFVITAFSFLVIERYLFSLPKKQWPEAFMIGFVIRIVIAVQLLTVISLISIDSDSLWPLCLLVIIGCLPAIVTFELVIRSILSFFTPKREMLEPKFLGNSLIASMLDWPPQPFKQIQSELQSHLGIDLQQVWAFTFLRKAFLPIFCLMIFVGWLLSGISVIPLNERGIYERFGEPVKVLKSGLHLGLPWPFGRVIAVEYGIIHEVSTSNGNKTKNNLLPDNENTDITGWGTTEGRAPESANRLWDSTHRNEKSQIIASLINQKQSFHILNMDVRVIYRIGFHDQDALNSIYNTNDISTLVQSTLDRILVHEFASRTLDEALVEHRDILTSDIKMLMQHNLDQLVSGVEVLAVVIEAIHPPAGAANAYHAVQAAQITTQVLISKEKANAIQDKSDAYIKTTELTNSATGFAKETLAQAEADSIRFNTEKLAWLNTNQAFLLEYYLSQLSLALSTNSSPLLIIDHRLDADNMPTIDWRNYITPDNVKIKATNTGD